MRLVIADTGPVNYLLPMDDRKGGKAAERKGLRVTGTLGVLDLAAERGILISIARLKSWNVQVSTGPKRC